MINWKIIFKILGSLLFIETALLLSSVAVSLFYHEFDSLAFIVSSLITLFFAFFCLTEQERKLDIFVYIQNRNQVKGLKDKTQILVA